MFTICSRIHSSGKDTLPIRGSLSQSEELALPDVPHRDHSPRQVASPGRVPNPKRCGCGRAVLDFRLCEHRTQKVQRFFAMRDARMGWPSSVQHGLYHWSPYRQSALGPSDCWSPSALEGARPCLRSLCEPFARVLCRILEETFFTNAKSSSTRPPLPPESEVLQSRLILSGLQCQCELMLLGGAQPFLTITSRSVDLTAYG